MSTYSLLSINLVEVVRKLATDTCLDDQTTEYVLQRLSAEGVKFLTVTLPKLSKQVLHSLEIGYFERPTCFQWKGKSLRYFRSFLDGIFKSDGKLQDSPCGRSIANLRQFCEYFYKLAMDFDEAQLRQAESRYLEIEREIADTEEDPEFIDLVRKSVETNYGLMGSTVQDVLSSFRPRFGPGAFFGSENVPENIAVYKNLDSSAIGLCRKDQKPFAGYFKSYPLSRELLKTVDEGRMSKVIFVPKDSRGPRVISKEPLHLLRCQLSFFDWLSSTLERSTNRRINFADQEINRSLALQGSIDKSWSTLDLKDASDRVSLSLCKQLFRNIPSISYYIKNWRSTHARLPLSGEEIRLNKLSGMGSGITFPIMALIIHASVCAQIQRQFGLPFSKVGSSVYVYGDDVVVPRKWYGAAVTGLFRVRLRVNSEKSFTNGHFRESCGGDYFRGFDVTPVRLKLSGAGLDCAEAYRDLRIRFYRKSTDSALLQLERHCRELIRAGLDHTAHYYYARIFEVVGPMPYISDDEDPRLGIKVTESADAVLDTIYESRVPGPVIVKEERACPYKYLGRVFSAKASDWASRLFPERANSYGEISVPRRLKIRKRIEGAQGRVERLFIA